MDCVPLPALTLDVHRTQKSLRLCDPEVRKMGLGVFPHVWSTHSPVSRVFMSIPVVSRAKAAQNG